jgi:glycosyltransferase involved in cell wall biosynthesis
LRLFVREPDALVQIMERISLVIPVRNEASTIESLIESIARQTVQPDEVVLVDGGSTDSTVEIIERIAARDQKIKLIRTSGATPGKGRNIGIDAAKNEWIALTDAGIILKETWLAELACNSVEADIVYGNYAPDVRGLFDRCAALTYVAAQKPLGIRGKFIASSLLKKEVWERVGGFPDLRAAEDLAFMEAVVRDSFREAFAPNALVHWRLRPDFRSTLQKFVLYSKHNVWAGREWDWHYGILRQYFLLLPFVALTLLHSWWWLLGVPVWLLARTTVRILRHRHEYGFAPLFNPLIFFGVAGLVLTIDVATYLGWAKAKLSSGKS